ncbi:uncharacterized protein LOC126747345 [Anthonomus grandis grandis]|uniref:uncharacterized protein LOC126747345 n=1 Tax=Anthonomus grandis grandis TaxID=2921223 RepID=UPI002165331D|nr:uncharacterized protein LOC126747345 [Anthonomus grandis grandis]
MKHTDKFSSFRDFNISFGYPRSDTCSVYDKHIVKMKSLQEKIMNTIENEAQLELQNEIKGLENENKLHKLKAATFYARKRHAKIQSRKNESIEAITMDFSRNLSTPNITTNDVYYKRQLTFVSFNIHKLATNEAVFHTCPETIAKKGADEVASLLHDFCHNILGQTVRCLEIFCHSCAGQNKNYTIIRLLHHMVHKEGRFDKIKITFPIRGHSYSECDKDFALIKQKTRVEVPSQWVEVFKSARVKPMPFNVIECTTDIFHAWTKFLTPQYKKTCPLPTRPIKELIISHQHPRTIQMRESYNGAMSSFVLIPPRPGIAAATPDKLCNGLIPIPKLKYDQLQELMKFVVETNNLLH